MRLLICDYQVVFAESLAHLLTAYRREVVAVTHRLDQLLDALRRDVVDICLLDVTFGRENVLGRLPEVRAASPGTHIVLLASDLDPALHAAARAAGVRGIGYKRQPAAEILDLLDRVYAGECVVAESVAGPAARSNGHRPLNDAQRLAVFLTPREREVLKGLVRGDDTHRLARSLGIAPATARCHVQNVLTKLGAHSRLEAATTAVRFGMISPETGDWLKPGDDPSWAAAHRPGAA